MAAYQFPSGHMCGPRSIITLFRFTLAGCAAVQQCHERVHTALTPYIGRTIADYVLDHGPPTNIVDLGSGKKGFQWLTTKTRTVSIVAHATKPDPALSDGVIEHWRWQGSADAHQHVSTCALLRSCASASCASCFFLF